MSATLLDGMPDRDSVVLIDLAPDGVALILSVEDMIADRMGQYASGTAPEMGGQAAILFALQPDVDRAYLDRCVRDESCGDHGIDDIPPA